MALAACAIALLAGFALKGQCLEGFDGRQYSRLCYNDIQPLFGPRLHVTDASGVQHYTFPYEHGLDDGELVDGVVEYPVLTGVFMWATGLLASDANQFLRVSALFLAPFAVATAYLLARMTGARALMWAAAPALVLYAFHNWDLLAVAATTAGFFLWWRGSPLWAAAAFGVGACFKLYPAAFLLPLATERLFARDVKGALEVAGCGLGTIVLINIPFAARDFDGWVAPFQFHRLRGPNFDNIWAFPRFGFPEGLTSSEINLRSAVVTGGLGLVALWIGWIRGRVLGAYPVVQVSAALLAAFLLINKVHSPQYTLWLLPFFALAGLHVAWWVAYSVVDLIVYVGVFRYFYDFVYLSEQGATTARGAMVFGVWARAALLLALFVAFLWSRARLRDPEDEVETTQRVTAPA